MAHFVEIMFEDTSDTNTEKLLLDLETKTQYTHLGGKSGSLIGSYTGTSHNDFVTSVIDIVHNHNDGDWCEVIQLDESQVELLI